MSAKQKKLEEIIRPVVEGLGYECWGIEYIPQGKHSLLRIFIEKEVPTSRDSVAQEQDDNASGAGEAESADLKDGVERESGIELADCEKVSRQLSGVLDVEEPISGDYNLEVSSPGLDRKLFGMAHFERFRGHQVALKLRMPFEGKRKYQGLLKGVEGNDIVLQVSDEEYLFPFEGIEKANVVPQFD